MTTFLSSRLLSAIDLAVQVHGNMTRKGDGSPYIVHPIAVFGLLTHWGANEDTCIAGLLHDVLEDVPEEEKHAYRKRIGEEYGTSVLEIVEGVTEQDKTLPWKTRKEHYLQHLRTAPQASLLVSCADKTHNALSLLAAYTEQGEKVWERFNASKEDKIWFLCEVLQVLEQRLEQKYVEELQETVAALSARTESRGRKLVCLISTAGKSAKQICTETKQAFQRYNSQKNKSPKKPLLSKKTQKQIQEGRDNLSSETHSHLRYYLTPGNTPYRQKFVYRETENDYFYDEVSQYWQNGKFVTATGSMGIVRKRSKILTEKEFNDLTKI